MPRTKNKAKPAAKAKALATTFVPSVRFEPTVLRQKDGSHLIIPGRPIIEQAGDEISIKEAARILGLSERRTQCLCDEGHLKEGIDWRQPGGPKGKLFLKRASVIEKSGKAPR